MSLQVCPTTPLARPRRVGHAPRVLPWATVTGGMALLLASCEANGPDERAVEAADDRSGTNGGSEYPTSPEEVAALLASEGYVLCSDDEAVDGGSILAPELDLASLEAAAPTGTFAAESYENAYVGEVSEDLLIGVSLDPNGTGDQGAVAVYLCDSDAVSAYLWGEFDDGAAALSDDDVEVELEVAAEAITGTVTVAGVKAPFTARPATAGSGMFVATDSAGEIDLEVRWVAVDDGRQRGRVVCCWPTSHITFACGCCLHPF